MVGGEATLALRALADHAGWLAAHEACALRAGLRDAVRDRAVDDPHRADVIERGKTRLDLRDHAAFNDASGD